jgi:hypothetical protein
MLLITTFVELRVVVGRTRTGAGRPHAVSGRPMLIHTCHATLFRGLERPLSEWHDCGMARARHGLGMECVNQTWQHCVNQMGKTQYESLAARHGRGTVWARHRNGMVCVN